MQVFKLSVCLFVCGYLASIFFFLVSSPGPRFLSHVVPHGPVTGHWLTDTVVLTLPGPLPEANDYMSSQVGEQFEGQRWPRH